MPPAGRIVLTFVRIAMSGVTPTCVCPHRDQKHLWYWAVWSSRRRAGYTARGRMSGPLHEYGEPFDLGNGPTAEVQPVPV